jgi:hypothetical protein
MGLMQIDPYALLGNACAVVAGLLVSYWLLTAAQHAAWSHQAAHPVRAA